MAPVITTHPAGGPITKGATKRLTVAASGTELTYQWYVGQSAIANATNSWYDTPAITSDATYFVRVTSAAELSADSNPATLTVCLPRAIHGSQPSTVSGSAVSFTAAGADGSETFEWYRGPSGVTSNLVGTGTSITVYPAITTEYWLRTKRPGCDADGASTTVVVCSPNLATQPASVGITLGQSTRLSVSASGPEPLSYQWYIGDAGVTSNPIADATAAFYDASPPSTTKYWARVTAAFNSACVSQAVNSSTAVVTVCQPASITSHPVDETVANTGYTNLSVTASGNVASYQWYEGASGVTTKPVGTNSNILRVVAGTTKYYWVRVTGTCGAAVHSNAALVSVMPTFTAQPANVTACANSTATFSVTATGDPATLTYQWYRMITGGAQEAIGGNSPSVTVTATAEMQVWCNVTSGRTTASSNCATLSIAAAPTVWVTMNRYSNGYYDLFANVPPEEAEFVKYDWYEGRLGDRSLYISWSPYAYVYPRPRPKYYWVRVTNVNTGCYKDVEVPFQ